MSYAEMDFTLADDAILPSQYFGRHLKDNCYRRVQLAVLFEAITDLKLHSAEMVGDAIDWLMCDDEHLPFSYRTCCGANNINADQLRDWLVKMCVGGQMGTLRIRNDSIETGPVKGFSQTRNHCVNGHEWTEENTLWAESRLGPYRHCRICARHSKREWAARRRTEKRERENV